MNSLSHGLNIPKPKKPTAPPKPKKPILGFAADDSDHDDGTIPPNSIFGKSALKGKSNTKKKTPSTKDKARVNAQLTTLATLSAKASETALAVDPSVYDYDGVWDDMKSVDRAKQAADAQDATERKPKYMESLLEAAEVRKRDALRAKERTLQKEREAEGEEFADKEKFVTSAYKKQQEELLRLEEEEKAREGRCFYSLSGITLTDTETMRKKSQGMSTFYRNMLDRTEAHHTALVAASTAPKDPSTAPKDPIPKNPSTKTPAQIAAERGLSVDINEEGQVVDKTQLLSGGLNLNTATKSAHLSSRGPDRARQQGGYQGRKTGREDVRARQTKMVEEQLMAAQKRALDEEEKEKAELERASKSRKTENDVVGAKERYLQRKREAEAAKAKGA